MPFRSHDLITNHNILMLATKKPQLQDSNRILVCENKFLQNHFLIICCSKPKCREVLSGGQQQRVSIGRALMNAPVVVLADEPTGNLDSKSSREIVELLKVSNEKYGQTLLVITHDESIALQADRILSIEDGKITRDEVIRR